MLVTGAPKYGNDDDYVDELPEDLNVSEFVGPYTFPNNNRRRIPAAIYLVIGVACLVVFALSDTDSALVNAGQYNNTIYGQQLWQLMQIVGAGGLVA